MVRMHVRREHQFFLDLLWGADAAAREAMDDTFPPLILNGLLVDEMDPFLLNIVGICIREYVCCFIYMILYSPPV